MAQTVRTPSHRRLRIGTAAALALGAFVASQITAANAQAPRLRAPAPMVDQHISFADLVEQVSPAVVSIYTEQRVERPPLPEEFQEFFGRRFGPQFGEQYSEPQIAQAQGSGFFVDGDGHIVTNNHVVEGAENITVKLADGTELVATLVGTDPATDLAVLQVDPEPGQPFVGFSEDVNLRVGDWVVAVGNPFGLGGTVTSGIISAIDRNYESSVYNDFIQIDAPINRGNSGGPTFDLNGRVVGVNTAIFSPTGGSVGIGFAIPADTASYVVSQLIEKGEVSRGWLGVEIRPFDANHAAAVGLESAKGALVVNVQPDTPAKQAGLQSGDIVLDFNGEPVEDARDLTRAVGSVEPGNKVELTVFRDGRSRKLDVRLGDRGDGGVDEPAADLPETEDSSMASLGLDVAPLGDTVLQRLGLDETAFGVVVTGVAPGSSAAEANLQPGMVIFEVDGEEIRSVGAFEKKVKQLEKTDKKAVILRVQVGDRKDFRALPLQNADDD